MAKKKGHLKDYQVIILVCLNIIMYLATRSRLAFLSAILVITGAILIKRGLNHSESPRKTITIYGIVLCSVFFLSAFFSLSVTASFDGKAGLLSDLDGISIFAGRLSMGKQALQNYPITLFGQPVAMNGASLDGFGVRDASLEYFYIDNLYIQLIVRHGVIVTLLFLFLMTAVMVRCWKTKQDYLVLILAIIAMRSIVQDYSFILSFNPFLFLIGNLLGRGHNSQRGHLEPPCYEAETKSFE